MTPYAVSYLFPLSLFSFLQITRVLLERLIVNRPHPWGLLITFIELIKNPVYKFWTHEFVKCAPDIEKQVIRNYEYSRKFGGPLTFQSLSNIKSIT